MNFDLLDLLLFALVTLHLVEAFRHLWRMRAALYWRGQADSLDSHRDKKRPINKIHLLIPVYEEETVIKSCVEYFAKFTHYPGVQLHYITTEKEGIDGATIVI